MQITKKEVEAIAYVTQLAADPLWGVSPGRGGQAAADFLTALNSVNAMLRRAAAEEVPVRPSGEETIEDTNTDGG